MIQAFFDHFFAWARDLTDLRRQLRTTKAELAAMQIHANGVERDLAMWQELSRCHDPRQHMRLAQDLHLAQAELQVLRGEDPHTASLGNVRCQHPACNEGGDIDWWLVAFVAGLLLFVAWLLLAVTSQINDGTQVHAQAFVAPVQTEETSTTTTTSTTVATITIAPPRTKSAPPPVVTYEPGTIEAQIVDAFLRFGAGVAAQAVDVARCESVGLNPHATGDAGERGLFQIHPAYHQERIRRLGFTWDQMYDVAPNVAVAVDLYADSGWGPWSCKP